jgi:hypothetical protein
VSLHRHNPARDENEPEIVAALEKVGALVLRLSGPGLPDLLVFKNRRPGWVLLEVKRRGAKLTPAQRELQERCLEKGAPLHIVTTPAQAVEAARGSTEQKRKEER